MNIIGQEKGLHDFRISIKILPIAEAHGRKEIYRQKNRQILSIIKQFSKTM